MATGGFGTQVTSQADPNLKRVLGGAAYLFTGLHRFSELAACEGRIEAEGFAWEGAFLALAIGNGRRAGGGIRLCPRAKLDDGFLDLTILPFPKSGKVTDLLSTLLDSGVDGMGTAYLLEALRSVDGLEAIVVITSDKCYDNREWVWGYRENEALGGKDPYSASKGAAEILTASYRHSFFERGQTGLATARAGNVIGGGDWAQDRLVPDIVGSFMYQFPLLPCWGNRSRKLKPRLAQNSRFSVTEA